MSLIDPALRTVAGFGLPGHEARPPSDPLPADRWTLAIAQIGVHRLSGLAAAAARSGMLPVTAVQRAELFALHRGWLTGCLRLERKLLDLSGELDAAGIASVVLKGPSFAADYPDPSLRVWGDVDILVGSQDLDRASGVLRELGHGRRLAEPRPGFVRRFGKAAVHQGRDRIEVDLHRTLVLGPYSMRIDPDALLREHATFELGGRTLRCLSPEHRFVHACIHAALGATPPRLASIRDAAQLGAGELDEDRVDRTVRDWRLGPVMDVVSRQIRELLAADPPRILGRYEGRTYQRGERKILLAYLGSARREGSTATSMLRVIPGVGAKLAYVRAVLFPDEAFAAARTGIRGAPRRARRARLVWAARRMTRMLRAGRAVETVSVAEVDA